jgi:Protein of unknown function (DUF2478)
VIQAIMLDTERDLAALVYDDHQDPDAVLRGFAAELNAEGCRVVGMVQAGQCADSSLRGSHAKTPRSMRGGASSRRGLHLPDRILSCVRMSKMIADNRDVSFFLPSPRES